MLDQNSQQPTRPRVCLVVLNWKQPDLTLACLESLVVLEYPWESLDIIVVDNASGDDSIQRIRDRFPGVTILENEENLGFAGGNNIGIDYGLEHGADYIMLLNNDTEVAPDMLEHLITGGESDAQIGVVTPTIFYYDDPDRIWCAGAGIDIMTGHTQHWQANQIADHTQNELSDVDFASGCAFCVKRSAILRTGSMDPRFFLYYEETDWCVRIRRAGFRCVYVPRSRVWHKVSSSVQESSPLQVYYMTRNRLLFLAKSLPWGRRRLAIMQAMLQEIVFVFLVTLRPKPHYHVVQRRARLLGIWDFLQGRFGKVHIEYHL